ncbi:MAG TPA: hypothetical protein PLN12_15065 [Flavobacteriales bacterium]|nr:hypothetical protein [Flavobacteriales bacterium]
MSDTIKKEEALRMAGMYPDLPKRHQHETKASLAERHKAIVRSAAAKMRKRYRLKVVWKEIGDKEFSYSRKELKTVLHTK